MGAIAITGNLSGERVGQFVVVEPVEGEPALRADISPPVRIQTRTIHPNQAEFIQRLEAALKQPSGDSA